MTGGDKESEARWVTHFIRQLYELGASDRCEVIADNDGNIIVVMEPDDWVGGDPDEQLDLFKED
jgi:hypothetical protein